MSFDPYYSSRWIGLEKSQRENYYKQINAIVENHPWLGIPLQGDIQSSSFPRLYNNSCIFWDSDPDKPVNGNPEQGDIIIFRQYWLAQSVSWLIAKQEFLELDTLREMGIGETKVGPLETEFIGTQNGTTPVRNDPLPKPLWDNTKFYSSLFTGNTFSMSANLERSS